jgi:hypothetical protein
MLHNPQKRESGAGTVQEIPSGMVNIHGCLEEGLKQFLEMCVEINIRGGIGNG